MKTEKSNDNIQNRNKFKISSKIGFICLFLLASACIISVYLNQSGNDELVITYNSVTQSETVKKTSSAKNTELTSKRKSVSVSSEKTLKTTTKKASQTEANYVFPADINKVSVEQLMKINGIGRITADKIISYRNQVGIITNLLQLSEIDGIGNATIDRLSEFLYVSDEFYCEYNDYQGYESAETSISYEEEPQATEYTQQHEPQLEKVNINTADAETISECLLINIELADKIIELREEIQYFSNPRELLYVDGISESMIAERMDYIEI